MKHLIVLSLFFAFNVNALINKLPPELFAKDHRYHSVKVSPDGKKLSVVIQVDGTRRLAVFDAQTFDMLGGANLGSRNEVGPHFWANNKRIIMGIWQRVGWKDQPENYGELAGVNYDGSELEVLYGYRAGEVSTGTRIKKRDFIRGWAEVLHTLPDDEEHVLISSTRATESGSQLARIHKMNVNTGILSMSKVVSPISYASFVAGKDGEVRFASGIDESYQRKNYVYANEEWKEITADFGKQFTPVVLSDDNRYLFYLDTSRSDKRGLYKLDLKSSESTEIYTDPKVDVTDFNLTTDDSTVYALRVDDGYPTYVMVNNSEEEAKIFKSLLATFEGFKINITSKSANGSKVVIYVSNDIDAGTYYMLDRSKGELSSLFANLEHLDIEQLPSTTPFTFKSFDDTEISGYITYPMNMAKDEKVPLVTLVHGGPRARDYWTFDREVQMLAAQGYAVARVNFRGSSGFGSSFMAAGNKQWGDAIQKDIIAGTRHILTQGKIDQDKVCIMGASFGGFSAIMSPILAPDLFKCAIAHVGVYDLQMMYEEGDIPDRLFGKSYLQQAVGNDFEMLRAQSPVHNIDKLQAEVFIAHGEEDRRVPFEQAEALKDAMDEYNKKYEWFIKRSEAHGFSDEGNRAEYYQKVSEFLAKHLS
jgi:dipeptidyl aminopeptidase/acylaminoacyl peptidase